MKWENSKLDKCLLESFDAYTSLLSESDLSEDEMDYFEEEFKELLKNYEIEQIQASELTKFKSLHDNVFDNTQEADLFYGAIIIIEDPEDSNKTLIIDGNHRANTVKSLYPKMSVPVIKLKIRVP